MVFYRVWDILITLSAMLAATAIPADMAPKGQGVL